MLSRRNTSLIPRVYLSIRTIRGLLSGAVTEFREVLLSGHHRKIEEWRREQAFKRTARLRPDLLKNAPGVRDEDCAGSTRRSKAIALRRHEMSTIEAIANDYLRTDPCFV